MHRKMPPLREDDHVRGDAGAWLTLVVYGDYDCPHTRASAAHIAALGRELGDGAMRFVFRHFPLRHMHAHAQLLAEVAEAAHTLGHFWQAHDRLMSHQRITSQDLLEDLKKSEIAVEDLRPLLGSKAIGDRIERDVEEGSAAGVHSTPTFFFNGVLHDGHYDLATLRSRAEAAQKRLAP